MRILGIIIALLLLCPITAQAQNCPSGVGVTCLQYDGLTPYAATGGTATRAPVARALDRGINILEFTGCDPTGVSDSTACIQAAIDYSINSSDYRAVVCPAGQYKTSYPLFLDPPGNLRGSAAVWGAGTTYAAGAVVTASNGVPFVSLQAGNLNHNPTADLAANTQPVWWQATTASPTKYNYSLAFYGAKKSGAPAALFTTGCIIRPTFNNAPAFWIGNGYGNIVEGVSIYGPNTGTRCQQPQQGFGFAIAGGASGATFTDLNNISVFGFYYGIGTGVNGIGTLADSNSFYRPNITNACVGILYGATQNYINSIYDPLIQANIGVQATLGTGVRGNGGNISVITSGNAKKFAITGSPTVSVNNNIITLTATLTTPDSTLTNALCKEATTLTAGSITGTTLTFSSASSPVYANMYIYGNNNDITPGTKILSGSGTTWTVNNSQSVSSETMTGQFNQCIYNAFTIPTADWGVVPFVLDRFNGSTNVITLHNLPEWSGPYGNTIQSQAGLATELQAAANLYVSELITVFEGVGIDWSGGPHVEVPGTPVTFVNTLEGFGGPRPNNIKDAYFNSDPATPPPASSPSDADLAAYYTSVTFPFIKTDGSAPTIIDGLTAPGAADGSGLFGDTLLLDANGTIVFKNQQPNTFFLSSRITSTTSSFTGDYTTVNTALGGGIFHDYTGYAPPASQANGLRIFATLFRSLGWGRASHTGFRPSTDVSPCLTPAQIGALGSLPAITNNAGSGRAVRYTVSYPLLWGGTQYKACDAITAAGTYSPSNTQSNHIGYSYGQALTTTNVPNLSWSIKQNSPVLLMNAEALTLMFPGLAVTLTCNSLTKTGIVQEVHPSAGLGGFAGYVTLINAQQNSTPYLLDFGVATCTGTTIGQPAYSAVTLTWP